MHLNISITVTQASDFDTQYITYSGGSRNVRKGGRRCDPTFSSWGFAGRCKPPNGVRGGAPEANAFWQQSIENQISGSPPCSQYFVLQLGSGARARNNKPVAAG